MSSQTKFGRFDHHFIQIMIRMCWKDIECVTNDALGGVFSFFCHLNFSNVKIYSFTLSLLQLFLLVCYRKSYHRQQRNWNLMLAADRSKIFRVYLHPRVQIIYIQSPKFILLCKMTVYTQDRILHNHVLYCTYNNLRYKVQKDNETFLLNFSIYELIYDTSTTFIFFTN